MNKSRILSAVSLVPLVLVLAACGSKQQPEAPPPVEDTAFKDMAGAIDEARGVEATLQQQKDDLDRTLQEHEHPSVAE